MCLMTEEERKLPVDFWVKILKGQGHSQFTENNKGTNVLVTLERLPVVSFIVGQGHINRLVFFNNNDAMLWSDALLSNALVSIKILFFILYFLPNWKTLRQTPVCFYGVIYIAYTLDELKFKGPAYVFCISECHHLFRML